MPVKCKEIACPYIHVDNSYPVNPNSDPRFDMCQEVIDDGLGEFFGDVCGYAVRAIRRNSEARED